MITALVQGELTSDPKVSKTQTGARRLSTTMRAPSGAQVIDVIVVALVADVIDRMQSLTTGDLLVMTGKLDSIQHWVKAGQQRIVWRLHATRVLSVDQAIKLHESMEAGR